MTTKPDFRIHSAGAANAYGFRPMSDAGAAFVNGFAATVPGKWTDGVFWFNDRFMPREALNASPLNIVAGIGDTAEHDREWPRQR